MNDSSNNQSSATSALRATARTPGSLLDLTTTYSRETKHGLRRRRANKITVVTVPDPHDRLTRSSGNGYGGGRLTKTRTHRPVRRAAWTFIASARQHVAKRFCGRRAVIIYANGSARFLNTTLSRFTRRPTDGVKREKSPRGDLRRIKKKKNKTNGWLVSLVRRRTRPAGGRTAKSARKQPATRRERDPFRQTVACDATTVATVRGDVVLEVARNRSRLRSTRRRPVREISRKRGDDGMSFEKRVPKPTNHTDHVDHDDSDVRRGRVRCTSRSHRTNVYTRRFVLVV